MDRARVSTERGSRALCTATANEGEEAVRNCVLHKYDDARMQQSLGPNLTLEEGR